MNQDPDPFETWLDKLEQRHLADLTFAEVRRGVQALSSLYVERRSKLASGAALDGAGKRAAFALYYAPLHFLLVREITRSLPAGPLPLPRILDLGCGTGAAGAAWALESAHGSRPALSGTDRNPWAVEEARWTYRTLGLEGKARAGDLDRETIGAGGIVAAFTVDELGAETRARLLPRLVAAAAGGASVLVIQPIARRGTPWWEEWERAFVTAGGRSDAWRFQVEMPPLLRKLDEAAGLDHEELTGRSLWLATSAVL